ncbi:MAG TPA: 50S ribosomal protein L22 [Victivallales bacterium]|nr:50S ribosomal protein L22 [Victivallales bacterium]
MEVRAVTKYVRISPEKARHVARLLQGKSATEALNLVDLLPKKAARLMAKTLRSAVANAENNFDLDREDLVVKEAIVGAAPTMKRFRPKARGMAGRILKRTSHFRIVLSND